MEAVAAIIAAVLKVGVPIYVAALIATSLLLFLPNSIPHQIGIDELRESYRGYLGVAFVAAISLLAATGLSLAFSAISHRFDEQRVRRRSLRTLRVLTVDEKRFLRPFIRNGRNTILAPISDGVSGGLLAKAIIFRSSTVFEDFQAPFNLQPIARALLTENPELLD